METITAVSRMHSHIILYDMHSRYLISALDGISDSDAHQRLNTKANHIAWLTGSLVQERYELAALFGSTLKQQAFDLFKDHQGILDNITYPPLSQFKDDWEKISPVLKDALVNAGEEKLDSSFEMMPGMKMTYFELITFTIYREANCIGQIALWRRLLGYPAMKYM
ncbi:hypothetical protein [Daejeonella oryzae]|uniref:hypothetical protein n=1 Tax=Daejeonella oryzae TaxID=1122943 RepID=UPI00047B54DE|nr:hypothetical protein [Daejeonella oryzae]